jgi:hypothetical protein
VLTIKGGRRRRVTKAIPNSSLQLWEELVKEADSLICTDDTPLYLFSVAFKPLQRNQPISNTQVNRKWRLWVKKPLGITADFYSIKHLYTTETISSLIQDGYTIEQAEQAIARHNGQTTTAMVRSIYDTENQNRKLERGKKITVRFA